MCVLISQLQGILLVFQQKLENMYCLIVFCLYYTVAHSECIKSFCLHNSLIAEKKSESATSSTPGGNLTTLSGTNVH